MYSNVTPKRPATLALVLLISAFAFSANGEESAQFPDSKAPEAEAEEPSTTAIQVLIPGPLNLVETDYAIAVGSAIRSLGGKLATPELRRIDEIPKMVSPFDDKPLAAMFEITVSMRPSRIAIGFTKRKKAIVKDLAKHFGVPDDNVSTLGLQFFVSPCSGCWEKKLITSEETTKALHSVHSLIHLREVVKAKTEKARQIENSILKASSLVLPSEEQETWKRTTTTLRVMLAAPPDTISELAQTLLSVNGHPAIAVDRFDELHGKRYIWLPRGHKNKQQAAADLHIVVSMPPEEFDKERQGLMNSLLEHFKVERRHMQMRVVDPNHPKLHTRIAQVAKHVVHKQISWKALDYNHDNKVNLTELALYFVRTYSEGETEEEKHRALGKAIDAKLAKANRMAMIYPQMQHWNEEVTSEPLEQEMKALVISPPGGLDTSQIRKLVELFELIDLDHSGAIEPREPHEKASPEPEDDETSARTTPEAPKTILQVLLFGLDAHEVENRLPFLPLLAGHKTRVHQHAQSSTRREHPSSEWDVETADGPVVDVHLELEMAPDQLEAERASIVHGLMRHFGIEAGAIQVHLAEYLDVLPKHASPGGSQAVEKPAEDVVSSLKEYIAQAAKPAKPVDIHGIDFQDPASLHRSDRTPVQVTVTGAHDWSVSAAMNMLAVGGYEVVKVDVQTQPGHGLLRVSLARPRDQRLSRKEQARLREGFATLLKVKSQRVQVRIATGKQPQEVALAEVKEFHFPKKEPKQTKSEHHRVDESHHEWDTVVDEAQAKFSNELKQLAKRVEDKQDAPKHSFSFSFFNMVTGQSKDTETKQAAQSVSKKMQGTHYHKMATFALGIFGCIALVLFLMRQRPAVYPSQVELEKRYSQAQL